MPRPWGTDAAALEAWGRIRAATDPNHTMIWMAEGLYPTYNPLFDGLYVYRIDHRDYPQSWLKQFRWANELRAVEQRGNLPIGGLYFADTIAAGFDDTRSVNAPADLRSDAPHFARDRRNGGYYADTFAATANTHGDFRGRRRHLWRSLSQSYLPVRQRVSQPVARGRALGVRI